MQARISGRGRKNGGRFPRPGGKGRRPGRRDGKPEAGKDAKKWIEKGGGGRVNWGE